MVVWVSSAINMFSNPKLIWEGKVSIFQISLKLEKNLKYPLGASLFDIISWIIANFNRIFWFLGHLFENVFIYSRHATIHWKNAKGFVHLLEKMSPGERPLCSWFGDNRLIGMYFLVDSRHMCDTRCWKMLRWNL